MPLTLAAAINTLRKEAEQERSYGNLRSSLATIITTSCDCAVCQKRDYVHTPPADFCGLIVTLSCLAETPSPTYADLFGADEDDSTAASPPPMPQGPTVDDLATGVGPAKLEELKSRLLRRD